MTRVRLQTSPNRIIQQSLPVLWKDTSQSVQYLCLSDFTGRYCFKLSFEFPLIKLYNYSQVFKYNRTMRLNSASKFVPNSFYHQSSDIQQFDNQVVTPFKPTDNKQNIVQKKNNRKNILPKIFIDDLEDQNIIQQDQKENIDCIIQDEKLQEQEQTRTTHNLSQSAIKKKANLLLQFEIEESSQEEKCQQILEPELLKDQVRLPAIKNFDKLKLVDWSNSNSDNDQIQCKKQPKQRKQSLKKTIKNQTVTFSKQMLFKKLEKGVECMLRRDKKNSSGFIEYSIYLKQNLQHIVTVRKEGVWNYCIYLREKGKGQSFFNYIKIATLQSSFLGNKFNLLKSKQKHSNITIYYETNILGLSGPRKIFAYLPKSNLPFEDLHELYDNLKYREQIQKCVSKTAKWDETAKSYVLNFHGLAKEASIKNFVITDKQQQQNNDFIIFGKAGKDVYNLNIKQPFSLIQGISVALTTFQRKITCD